MWEVLKAEGAKQPGFRPWRERKWKEIEGDELLRFINTARIDDYHKGEPQLGFCTHVAHLNTSDVPPAPPGAAFVIGAEGPAWVLDVGTPRERTLPITSGRQFCVFGALVNPPRSHKGEPVETDPISVCAAAIAFYEDLVYEARQTFGGGR